MTEDTKTPNRIPFESVTSHTVSNWALPTMNGRGRILKSAEIERKQAKSRRNEKVEDISSKPKPKPMTAEQLQLLAEEGRKEGYAEGYAEGLKKGTEQGLTKGTQQGQEKAYRETKAEVLDTQNRLRSIAQCLFEPMQQQNSQLENTLVDMAMQLAKHLIHQEITQSPAILFHVVQRAVSALPVGEKNITVVLNDKDADLIEHLLSAKKQHWQIERDDQITTGGCIIKTENSLIDYEIENRLNQYLRDVNDLSTDALDVPPEVDHVHEKYADELADIHARMDSSRKEDEAIIEKERLVEADMASPLTSSSDHKQASHSSSQTDKNIEPKLESVIEKKRHAHASESAPTKDDRGESK